MRVNLDHPLYLQMLAGDWRPCVFVEMSFASSALRFNSSPFDISADFGSGTQLFLGNSVLGSITSIEESTEVAAKGIQIRAIGQGTGFYEEILSERYRNRPVRIWLAALNSSSAVISGAWYMLNEYRMDKLTTRDSMGEGGFEVSLSCESELVDLFGLSDVRYTPADQLANHPGDTVFDFIGALPGRVIPWGKESATSQGWGTKRVWTWGG